MNLLVRQNTTQKVTGKRHAAGGKQKEKLELLYIRSCLRDELGIKIGVKTGEIDMATGKKGIVNLISKQGKKISVF